jgi:hypothetical protein
MVGYAGDGLECGRDKDGDGWAEVKLNCTSPLCKMVLKQPRVSFSKLLSIC